MKQILNNFSHINSSGNGKAIPEFKLIPNGRGTNQGKIVPKYDAQGNRVTRNLYLEIQEAAKVSNIQNYLIQLAKNGVAAPNWIEQDVSEISETTIDEALTAQANIKNKTGIDNMSDVEKYFSGAMKAYIENKMKQASKASETKVDAPEAKGDK